MSVHQRASVGTLAAGAKLERYEILAKLAAGGMATVYVARVQAVAGFERQVAIKVLHANLAHEDEFISMFLDEARLAASIRHPNVVSTIDVSDAKEAGCGYFIVMEYIEGDHLGALMASAHKAGEKLALPVVLRMVADALGGLGAAHGLCDDAGRTLNLVHRDVSPHNIMVGRDGVVRLTDFGVAKAEDRLTHTRDGQVKGKLAYMAPEQAVSGATDARSDLFSVGVILWECVTGRRLFRADTTAATLNKLLREPIAAPSSIDPTLAPLDALLAKALAREPEARFQSADEFARAIEELAPTVGGLASLRGVARTVKQHAAAKLKREKKLVDDALRALRPEEELDDLTSDTIDDELSAPSNTEISVVSASLSASKQSGVFAHDTQPGNAWAMRHRGSPDATTGSLSALSAELAAISLPPKAAASSMRMPAALASLARWASSPVRVGIAAFCVGAGVGVYYLVAPPRHLAPAAPVAGVEVPPVAAEATAKAVQGWVNGRGASIPSVTTVNTAASPKLGPVPPVAAASVVGPIVEPARAPSDDSAEEAVRKANRARVERPARGTARPTSRRVRKDPSTVRSTGEATPAQTSPGADDVMPNPYHTR